MRYLALALVLVATVSLADDSPKAKFPPAAQARIESAVEEALRARQAYHASLEATRSKLVKDLEQQLQLATKAGNLDGALALKAEIERVESQFATYVEEIAGDTSMREAIEKALLGRWQVRLESGYRAEWTFLRNGVVRSTNGTPQGTWKINLDKQRIDVTWTPKAGSWINLPLRPSLATGMSRTTKSALTARRVQGSIAENP